MQTGKVFFTKNGVNLGKGCQYSPCGLDFGLKSLTITCKGVAFTNVKGMLFPSASCEDLSDIEFNFGESKSAKSRFVYDIEAHDWTVEDSAAAVGARNSKLSKGLGE